MDIATTFPLLKPLFSGFSSHSAALVSGYGGLHTFVESDPGMKDREKANVSAEMHRIARNGQQGVGHSLEEEGIQRTGVVEGQRMERVGQGKDDREGGHLEELPLSGCEPGSLRHPLTRGTVAIPTRVVAALAVAAVVTLGRVAPQHRGPAQGDGPEHTLLRRRGPVPVSCERGCPILPNDIGDFKGGRVIARYPGRW
jgi:hypothetical protein